jgi:hypothetical protein
LVRLAPSTPASIGTIGQGGIRYGGTVPEGMVASRLTGDLEWVVVGAPRYLTAHGRPETPEDLLRHRCIRIRTGTDRIYKWELGAGDRMVTLDGTPTGLITAEIVNWTGHVILAPRSRLADLLQRKEPSRTGVYFLFGPDPSNPAQTLLYIGESENVGKRMAQHNKDNEKAFWERVCIITSKDQNITKGHGKYLESRLIEIAKKAGRAKLANGTAPEYGGLPEADLANMEFFLEQIRVVLPVLGLDFLRDTILAQQPAPSPLYGDETPVIKNAEVSLESMGLMPPVSATNQLTVLQAGLGENRASFPRMRPSAAGQESPLFLRSRI